MTAEIGQEVLVAVAAERGGLVVREQLLADVKAGGFFLMCWFRSVRVGGTWQSTTGLTRTRRGQ